MLNGLSGISLKSRPVASGARLVAADDNGGRRGGVALADPRPDRPQIAQAEAPAEDRRVFHVTVFPERSV